MEREWKRMKVEEDGRKNNEERGGEFQGRRISGERVRGQIKGKKRIERRRRLKRVRTYIIHM